MPETVDHEALWVEPKTEPMVEPGSSRAMAPGESVWNELETLIDRQATKRQQEEREKGETYEQREARRYQREHEAASRDEREKHRELWRRYHLQQAERLRSLLSAQVEHHEQQAERYAAMSV